MATAGSVHGHGARFAAACDVLSRYVKAASSAVTTTTPTTVDQPRPAGILPLMPGADLSTCTQEEPDQAGPPPAPSAQLMTISYGGRVVVLDDVPADKAAELLRLAAAAQGQGQGGGAPRVLLRKEDGDLLPMARKASLRQFMEKRKGRVAKRGSPYSRPDAAAAPAASSFPDHLALTL